MDTAKRKQILAELNIAHGAGEVRIQVKLAPKAAANRVGGVAHDAEGAPYLKASVCAVPEDNAANQAPIALLSEYLALRKSAITLIHGHKSRMKTLAIDADA